MTFMVSLLGYSLAAGFLLSAVWELFEPERVGLWRWTSSDNPWAFSLGVIDAAPDAVELLGGWLTPLCLLLGLAAGWLTWRFSRAAVRLMARGGRQGRGG